jgi:hypothetical protein
MWYAEKGSRSPSKVKVSSHTSNKWCLKLQWVKWSKRSNICGYGDFTLQFVKGDKVDLVAPKDRKKVVASGQVEGVLGWTVPLQENTKSFAKSESVVNYKWQCRIIFPQWRWLSSTKVFEGCGRNYHIMGRGIIIDIFK